MSDAPEEIYLYGDEVNPYDRMWCDWVPTLAPKRKYLTKYIRADLADPMRDAPDLQETISYLTGVIQNDLRMHHRKEINDALTLLKAQQEQIAAHHQEIKIISNQLDEIISLLAPPQEQP